MGQTLSEPVVDKHSDQGHDSRLAYGVSEMQGWRLSEWACRSLRANASFDWGIPTRCVWAPEGVGRYA